MDAFRQTIEVGNPAGGNFVEIDALVDARNPETVLPASLLDELNLEPHQGFECTADDGVGSSCPAALP